MRFAPPHEEVVLYTTAFGDDLLGRNQIGKRLSEIVDRIEDPLVIALDGHWGTGKSHFLQRWVGAHKVQNAGKALTIYFDAFTHDYMSDPLVALVSEIAMRFPATDKSKLDKVKTIATRLIRPATRIGLAIASFGATKALGELGDAAVKAIEGETKDAVEEFWKREQGRHGAMVQFRSAIEALTKSDTDSVVTPLVIVIDELDRCRPDYALETLEIIKHFFDVPHVHFILGVSLRALKESVRVRYGSGTDATTYLQKFLSFTITLPDHIGDHEGTLATIKYATALGSQMQTPMHMLEEILDQLKVISRRHSITMREVEKVMSTVSLLPEAAIDTNLLPGWRVVIITLVIVRILNPDIFQDFANAAMSDDGLIDYFSASSEKMKERDESGNWNNLYDHKLFYLYNIWRFICQNGDLKDSELNKQIASAFSRFGDRGNVRKIPQKILDDYLGNFKLT